MAKGMQAPSAADPFPLVSVLVLASSLTRVSFTSGSQVQHALQRRRRGGEGGRDRKEGEEAKKSVNLGKAERRWFKGTRVVVVVAGDSAAVATAHPHFHCVSIGRFSIMVEGG